MTWQLSLILGAGAVVSVTALAAAGWGVYYALGSLRLVRELGIRNGRRIAAQAILARSAGLTAVLAVLTLVGLLRLTSEAPVHSATYSVFTLLAVGQVLLAGVVVIDTYERTALRRHYQASPEAPTRTDPHTYHHPAQPGDPK